MDPKDGTHNNRVRDKSPQLPDLSAELSAVNRDKPSEQIIEEEDPLVAAQREREEREKALEEAAAIQPYDDPELKVSMLIFSVCDCFCDLGINAKTVVFKMVQAFYADIKDVDRENEVNRILGAFKLNPFEALGLRFDKGTEDAIRKQYRKVSLAVHPDKCSHPRAADAFEILGNAQKDLLNEEKRKTLDFLLSHAKEEVLKEWKKAAKKDAATGLAAMLHEEGKVGVQAAWENTVEFHEAWKLKARDVLARAEWRRRKLTKRLKEEEERAKEEHKKGKEEMKKKRQVEKAWESGREDRVGSWRTFQKGGKREKRISGLKPPTSKMSDEEKRYVQRPLLPEQP